MILVTKSRSTLYGKTVRFYDLGYLLESKKHYEGVKHELDLRKISAKTL